MVSLIIVTLLQIGCSASGVIEDGDETGSVDTQQTETIDTGPVDTGSSTPTRTDTGVNQMCFDFEDGSLFGAGYTGTSVTLWDGAVVSVVEEGTDFSGLNGEETVEMPGRYSVAIRSSDAGDTASFGIASTPLDWLVSPVFSWWQLSEVSESGIWLAIDIIDVDGYVLGSLELPVVTGGHEAGLLEGQAEIDGLDLRNGPGSPGEFVKQAIDVSEWLGMQVTFVFYQHTLIEGNGFFTLLDDLCQSDDADNLTLLQFGAPDDWGL
jgi:hypothetical protein